MLITFPYRTISHLFVILCLTCVQCAFSPDHNLLDIIRPKVTTASTPSDGATGVAPCSGSPCRGKIVIVFNDTMDTTLAQILTTEIFDGTSYVVVSNAGTTFTWSQTNNTPNDTLTINISWLWFPENSLIRFTLGTSGLKNTLGKEIAAPIQQTFMTGSARASFVVSDTGITSCYNDTTTAGCTGAGGTWPRQDGDFTNTPTARSFTGPTQNGSYSSDYTTADNVRGVIWKSCPEGLSGSNCGSGSATTMTWTTAINQCSALNSMNNGNGFANTKTWRLPNVAELIPLIHFGVSNPAIDAANFPATPFSEYFWTLSGDLSTGANVMAIIFGNGQVNSAAKNVSRFVRCVSSPVSTSAMTLSDIGDGTISDTVTSLRWQKCAMGRNNDSTCSDNVATDVGTWSTALQYCNSLALAGRSWRLPSTPELLSIVDYSVTNPAIASTYFPSTSTATTYSVSSTLSSSLTSLAPIGFSVGSMPTIGKAGSLNVRCVSTGP